MKFKDVSIGMRVCVVSNDGEHTSFHDVTMLDHEDEVVCLGNGCWISPVKLRKVKPRKKDVSFDVKVYPAGILIYPGRIVITFAQALRPFIGKRVKVTVKEIK